MKNQFYQNIGILILINLLIKPLYIFGIDAEVQNQIGDSAYGLYFALFNFLFIFQWILDPGIQNYNSQALSKDRSQLSALIQTTLVAKSITAIIYIMVIGLASCLFFGWHLAPIVILMIITSILTSFCVFLRSHFSAMGHYITDSLLSSIDKLLLVIVLGYILYWSNFDMSILWFVQVQCSVLLVSLIVIGICFTQKFGIPKLNLNLESILSLLKTAYPFAMVFILMSLYNRLDGVMLKFLVDDDSVSAGIYASGFRIYDALNMIGYLFATLLLPMYAHTMQSKEQLHRLYDESLRLMITIAVIVSIGLFYFGGDILDLIYDHSGQEHYEVLKMLSLSFFSVSLSYIFGTMIAASAKLKIFNILLTAGVILNFGLNLYLIPIYLAEGAAIATLITQSLLLLGQIILVHRRFAFNIDYKMIGQLISIILVTIISFTLVKTYLPIHFLFQGIISGIISLAYILALKFLRLDVIKTT